MICSKCKQEVGPLFCGHCREEIKKEWLQPEDSKKLITMLHWHKRGLIYVFGCHKIGCNKNVRGFCKIGIIDLKIIKLILEHNLCIDTTLMAVSEDELKIFLNSKLVELNPEDKEHFIPLLYFNEETSYIVPACYCLGCPWNRGGFCSSEHSSLNSILNLLHPFDGDNIIHQVCG